MSLLSIHLPNAFLILLVLSFSTLFCREEYQKVTIHSRLSRIPFEQIYQFHRISPSVAGGFSNYQLFTHPTHCLMILQTSVMLLPLNPYKHDRSLFPVLHGPLFPCVLQGIWPIAISLSGCFKKTSGQTWCKSSGNALAWPPLAVWLQGQGRNRPPSE